MDPADPALDDGEFVVGGRATLVEGGDRAGQPLAFVFETNQLSGRLGPIAADPVGNREAAQRGAFGRRSHATFSPDSGAQIERTRSIRWLRKPILIFGSMPAVLDSSTSRHN